MTFKTLSKGSAIRLHAFVELEGQWRGLQGALGEDLIVVDARKVVNDGSLDRHRPSRNDPPDHGPRCQT